MNPIGERIRQARLSLGMTQEQLARGLATKGFISQVEHNRATPSLPKLTLIAARLGIPAADLVGGRRTGELTYLRKSAEVALRAQEPESALRSVDEAASLQATANERSDLLRLRGTALSLLGRQEEALGVLQAAAATAPTDDPELNAAIYVGIGAVLQIQEQFNAAIEANLRAQDWLAKCKHHGDPEVNAQVLTNLGITTYHLGQTTQAIDYFNQALIAATAAESLFRIANAHMSLGVAARAVGDLDRAIEHCHRALEIHARIRQERYANRILNNLGDVYFAAGDLQKARHYQTKCLVRARELNDSYEVAVAASELARYALILEEPDQAIAFARESRAAAMREGDHLRHGLSLALEGKAAAKKGHGRAADKHFQQAFELLMERHAGAKLAEVCVLYGDVLRERGDVDRAFAFMRMASERDFRKLPALLQLKKLS